jgi:hypothetical protein
MDGWLTLTGEELANLRALASARENIALRQRVVDLEAQQINLMVCVRLQVPFGPLEIDLEGGRARVTPRSPAGKELG